VIGQPETSDVTDQSFMVAKLCVIIESVIFAVLLSLALGLEMSSRTNFESSPWPWGL